MKHKVSAKQVVKIFKKYDQSISERSAYRYMSILREEGYLVDAQLMRELALVRSQCKFASTQDALRLYFHIKAEFKGTLDKELTGEEVVRYFEDTVCISVPKSTLSSWFKPLGGFNKYKRYSVRSLIPIMVKAYILYQKISAAWF